MLQSTKLASPLSRKATLVSVIIAQWTARKLDSKSPQEVNRTHGALEDAGRYNKLLIEDKRLEAINSLVSQARKLHHTMTKPWCDEGLAHSAERACTRSSRTNSASSSVTSIGRPTNSAATIRASSKSGSGR